MTTADSRPVLDAAGGAGVMPVLTVDRPGDGAGPLADALAAGGLPVRRGHASARPGAEAVLRADGRARPGLLVGAGHGAHRPSRSDAGRGRRRPLRRLARLRPGRSSASAASWACPCSPAFAPPTEMHGARSRRPRRRQVLPGRGRSAGLATAARARRRRSRRHALRADRRHRRRAAWPPTSPSRRPRGRRQLDGHRPPILQRGDVRRDRRRRRRDVAGRPLEAT